jgi:hypothetical protein
MSTFEGNNGLRVKGGGSGLLPAWGFISAATCKQTSQRRIGVALEVKR